MKYDNELASLLTLDPPTSQPRKIGFLEITGQEYKETVNTRLYAYFLDRNRNPELSALFITALLDLIRQKSGKTLPMADYDCKCEEFTNEDLRIDLLISDNACKSAIIIENKLYHSLKNNLTAYYNHVKFEEKIGVLLTLQPVPVPLENQATFVNILHKEWIDAVKQRGIPAGLPVNTYIYLNDFLETITNLTRNTTMDDQADFFFKYPTKILKAKECYDHALQYINSQLEIVAENYHYQISGKGSWSRHMWADSNPDAYYLIDFTDLLNDKKEFTILLELYGKAIKEVPKLDTALAGNTQLQALDRKGYQSNTYWHFAKKGYNWEPHAGNLSNFIVACIEKDFHRVMADVLKFFHEGNNQQL